MGSDFEDYEKGYLMKLREQGKDKQKEQAYRKAERIKQEKFINDTVFTVWDYVLLESIRRGDYRIMIRIGSMQVLTSMKKLFLAGWIEKPKSDIPFDDMERLAKFMDSYEYKQYKDRLNRIMTREYLTKRSDVCNTIGIKNIGDQLILTKEGKRVAKERRDTMYIKWDKLRRLYRGGKNAELQQLAKANAECLPMFFAMGLANGALIASMMSDARVDYPYWYEDLQVAGGSTDIWGITDNFDASFEFDDS